MKIEGENFKFKKIICIEDSHKNNLSDSEKEKEY